MQATERRTTMTDTDTDTEHEDTTSDIGVGAPGEPMSKRALRSRERLLSAATELLGGCVLGGHGPVGGARQLSPRIAGALQELKVSLPGDIRIANVYSQRSFIDRAIDNVVEALADGGVLVLVILFLFLLNFRTTFITLTAIPLSIIATACVFAAFGLSINTMTLGGLAVAIGELVDDAIVDVENIFRRLKENRLSATPMPALEVVYKASIEVRSSVVYGTAIVVLVFIPLFALEGMEGKLFVPLAMGYVVSLIASLAVSLTGRLGGTGASTSSMDTGTAGCVA
jgi:Cu/Ag efflux pump CusA